MFLKFVLYVLILSASIFTLENILPKLKERKRKRKQKEWNKTVEKLEIK